ncbi:MAG TPA: rhomboid family intramembrane serine protease [Armatimonadetes bacterium]|nr:rhomboid family intramembrane serine protease [Armatimonadota bacterium]
MLPLRDNIPSRTFPIVNVGIIIACVVVFFFQMGSGGGASWAFSPGMLSPTRGPGIGPAATSLFLSMFMHGGLMHLAGNMLFLWVFGDNVEDRMGHLKYLIFYLVTGVAATLAHSAFALMTGTGHISLVGASGAIAGVLGAYLVLFRHARVRTLVIFFFITVVEIPAGFFLVFWFIIQVLSIGAQSGVAYIAHVGGFVTGWLLVRVMADTTQPRPPLPPPPPPRVTSLRIE